MCVSVYFYPLGIARSIDVSSFFHCNTELKCLYFNVLNCNVCLNMMFLILPYGYSHHIMVESLQFKSTLYYLQSRHTMFSVCFFFLAKLINMKLTFVITMFESSSQFNTLKCTITSIIIGSLVPQYSYHPKGNPHAC